MNKEQEKQLADTKLLINELSNIQDLYFSSLVDTLGVAEGAEELLYDYVFNVNGSLEEYLKNLNKELSDVISE